MHAYTCFYLRASINKIEEKEKSYGRVSSAGTRYTHDDNSSSSAEYAFVVLKSSPRFDGHKKCAREEHVAGSSESIVTTTVIVTIIIV